MMSSTIILLLEENIGINLIDLGLGKALLDMTLEVQVTKEKDMNWTLSKLKTFVLQQAP